MVKAYIVSVYDTKQKRWVECLKVLNQDVAIQAYLRQVDLNRMCRFIESTFLYSEIVCQYNGEL